MQDIGITEVTVIAARTFHDPEQDWIAHHPQVSLTAGIGPGGEHGLVVKRLQTMAEQLVDEHCEQFLKVVERWRNQQETKRREDQQKTEPPAAETLAFRQSPHDVYPPPSPPAA